AFDHNPSKYAEKVSTPTLLMHGNQDPRVKDFEARAIYDALDGPKVLQEFPEAGHGNYIEADRPGWERAIEAFLSSSRYQYTP
ncbi:MAG: prolyl oligopeptidase family serine peptidase, partial [Bacteroidota bacterium]